MKPEDTEVWSPVPRKVTPGTNNSAPSDAIVLFDGKNRMPGPTIKATKLTGLLPMAR
ncbi:hypothetical protein MKQ70_11680 [Chitinophaga sedimenti]|uniref:hypothetical protein n=1 Tax=Chitinophaga sedimenti TaxID=2033606 RepID=UPI0020057948|nr:hypothetical protein [Chitinophaga sedimenti]MCK7555637.1 hypothetical protein [Chitinophaga sedimenti]